jgi:hypothetical protein
MPFTTPSCPGGSDGTVRALVTGGTPPYSFLWIPGASTDSVITGIAADIWKVIVTDHHNCTATNSINVPEPSDFEVYPYVFDATCNGSSNGSATVSVTGGTAPYSYKWSNQSSGPVLMNASDNTYTVTITDANQCTFLSSVVVIQPLPLQVNTTVTNSSGSNGTATASVSGGTTPYSYSWSNEESAPVDTDLAPSQYSITVTDANGCTAFATVTVPFGVGIAAIGNGLFNFSVFPNPSSGLVGLEFSCTSGVMRGEISIADLSGRIVYREQETIGDRVQKILDANSFSPGLYTVQLSAGGCSLRQKLIIAR